MIDVKSDLYEIESKIMNLHRELMRDKFILIDESESQPELETMLDKRAPSMESEDKAYTEEGSGKRKTRFSKDTTKVLKDWFLENINRPYPK